MQPHNMKEILNYSNDSQLSNDLLKIATSELSENQFLRQQCLDQLRDWILKNEDIINARIDDTFLLRFLRANKFTLLLAQQMILKYLNIRRTFPHLSTQLDCSDVKLYQVISNGYIFSSPNRDKLGRRVIIVNASNFNAKLYGCEEQAKAHFLTYECLMEDSANQVMGVTHIGDFKGVSAQHITNWNPSEFARIFKWSEQSLPMRHKAVHLLHVPSTLKWLIEFSKNRVSAKMQNRLQLHNNVEELSTVVGIECLPKEWGGVMPMQEMVELWKHELLQKRDIILRLDRMRLLSDYGIRKQYNSCTGDMKSSFHDATIHVQGSFRKLEVD